MSCPKFYFIIAWFHQTFWEFFFYTYIYIYKPKKNPSKPVALCPKVLSWLLSISGYLPPEYVFFVTTVKPSNPVDPQAQVLPFQSICPLNVQLIKRNLLNNFYFNFYTAYGGGGGGACTWLWIFISGQSEASENSPK